MSNYWDSSRPHPSSISHIRYIPKNTVKKLGSLYCSRKYPTPPDIFSLYKCQISKKIDFCHHIYAGAGQLSHSSVTVQKYLYNCVSDELFLNLQLLSLRQTVTDLSKLCCYFYEKCSDRLNSQVPPIQKFTDKIHPAMYTGEIQHYSLYIPFVRRNFHSDRFFPRSQ